MKAPLTVSLQVKAESLRVMVLFARRTVKTGTLNLPELKRWVSWRIMRSHRLVVKKERSLAGRDVGRLLEVYLRMRSGLIGVEQKRECQ